MEVKDDHSYTAGGLAAHNCQSFSIAGRREGLEGESGLIHEIFRLLRETREEDRPQWLIYENVKGMFSSNRGFDFLAILLEMDKYGYDTEWNLFNSKDFGVPQNRERVYTVGHSRRYRSAEVFPLERTDGTDNIQESPSVHQVGGVRGSNRDNPNQYRVYDKDGLAPCLNQMEGGGRQPHIITAANYPSGGERSRILDKGGISFALSATEYKQPVSTVVPLEILAPLRES